MACCRKNVGAAFGAVVDAADGAAVGAAVDAAVGAVVGAVVGAAVGAVVGATVGAAVDGETTLLLPLLLKEEEGWRRFGMLPKKRFHLLGCGFVAVAVAVAFEEALRPAVGVRFRRGPSLLWSSAYPGVISPR